MEPNAGDGSPRRSHGLKGALQQQQRHFYEEADPDRALAMLEEEMSLDLEEDLVDLSETTTLTDSALRATRGLLKLRELLEKECEAQVG